MYGEFSAHGTWRLEISQMPSSTPDHLRWYGKATNIGGGVVGERVTIETPRFSPDVDAARKLMEQTIDAYELATKIARNNGLKHASELESSVWLPPENGVVEMLQVGHYLVIRRRDETMLAVDLTSNMMRWRELPPLDFVKPGYHYPKETASE